MKARHFILPWIALCIAWMNAGCGNSAKGPSASPQPASQPSPASKSGDTPQAALEEGLCSVPTDSQWEAVVSACFPSGFTSKTIQRLLKKLKAWGAFNGLWPADLLRTRSFAKDYPDVEPSQAECIIHTFCMEPGATNEN